MRDTVSSPYRKNILLSFCLPATDLYAVHSTKGRIAVVTDAELDAMDGSISQASGIDTSGQAVWFWLPDAGVKFADWRCRPSVRHAAQTMVANKPGTPGRARSSRKTIAQGMPDCFGDLW
jgi:hypothetical protein